MIFLYRIVFSSNDLKQIMNQTYKCTFYKFIDAVVLLLNVIIVISGPDRTSNVS